MKRQALWGFLVLVIMICLSGATAHAQGFDTFVGYSFDTSPNLHGYNVAFTWRPIHNVGFEANFAGHHGSLTPFAVTAPTTGSVDEDDDTFTYTFGPKLIHHVGPGDNFEMFAHFLVGGAHVHSSTVDMGPAFCEAATTCNPNSQKGSGFGFVTGAGLDWYHGHWGIRILEGDFVLINADLTSRVGTTTEVFTRKHENFRMVTGVIWRWGGQGK